MAAEVPDYTASSSSFAPSSCDILVGFGSVSGNAESVALRIVCDGKKKGFNMAAACLNDFQKLEFEKKKAVLLVCSTTGEGDFPENAIKFSMWLRKRSHPSDLLSGLYYAVLGLGDSNYTQFCNAGRILDSRFSELGATKFYDRGDADDGLGLEIVIEPWVAQLWDPLSRLLQSHQHHITQTKVTHQQQPATELVIGYGSVSGNAESIAQRVASQASADSYNALVNNLNAFIDFDLSRKVLVIVCSTTGDGEVPDNALRFAMWLRRRTHPPTMLQGLRYALLSLGDSNYAQFCNAGKTLDARLKELGAEPFLPRADADDGTDLEVVVEPWLRDLWSGLETLRQQQQQQQQQQRGSRVEQEQQEKRVQEDAFKDQLHADTTIIPTGTDRELFGSLPPHAVSSLVIADITDDSNTLDHDIVPPTQKQYSQQNPFVARVLESKVLTKPGASKIVVHVSIDLGDSGLYYLPGDALGIICQNRPEEVDRLLQLLDAKPNHRIAISKGAAATVLPSHIPTTATLAHIFTNCCDVRGILKKKSIRAFAEHCRSPADRYHMLLLSSTNGKDLYNKFFLEEKKSIIQLLELYPSCKPPLNEVMEALPPLQPRFYSASSSPLVYPHAFHFAYTLVQFQTPDAREYSGLCTSWLYEIHETLQKFPFKDIRIAVFIRETNHFRLPEDPNACTIMIGPGTGVAPFIGFLQHRQCIAEETRVEECSMSERCVGRWRGLGINMEDMDITPLTFGSMVLFFGCRTDNEFIYEEDILKAKDNGTLDKLYVAFSRSEASKVYVQHHMKNEEAYLYNLLIHHNAHCYICGDGAKMAKEVQETLASIIEKFGEVPPIEAKKTIASWIKQGRLHLDVWSS